MIIALAITTVAFLIGLAVTVLIGLRVRKHVTDKPIVPTETRFIAKRVFNLIILDESGSMQGLEKVSVVGVNETIQAIQESYESFHEQEQLLTFITFSSTGDSYYRKQFDLVPISMVNDIDVSDYIPRGETPLYNTMGKALTELEGYVTDSDIVLVTIITDGQENSSREYDQEMIKALIKRLDEKDWIFTYIGANQDAILEADKMGIRNARNYRSDVAGTREMWESEKKAREQFMEGTRSGVSKKRLKSDYFIDND